MTKKTLEEKCAEHVQKKIDAKKRGRKKQPFLSYEEAKKVVQDEMIPSVKKYDLWWAQNRPKKLPRYPHRVYENFLWSDFLGNGNEFNKPMKVRPFEEAMVFVHKLNLKGAEEWKQWCKTPDRPNDIPTRPDLTYSKWISWKHWLGSRPIEMMEAKKVVEEVQVFFIAKEPNAKAENIFVFGIEEGGISGLKEKVKKENISIVAAFWNEKAKIETIKNMLNHLSTPYYGEERKRIVPNIFQVIWYLQTLLRQIRLTDVNTL